jgi:hypothetical protein
MRVQIEDHLRTLAEYPPVQVGASFDMSTIVIEFIEKTVAATGQLSIDRRVAMSASLQAPGKQFEKGAKK